MKQFLEYLWGVIARPRATFNKLALQPSLGPAMGMVLGYGLINGVLFLISYLSHDWPPPQAELDVWISAWGEFSQLPFLKIPAEQYRLFLAVIMLPLTLAIWMLMAGTAHLLGRLYGGRTSFDQYLNLFGFSFFTFAVLAAALDTSYNLLLGPYLVPALQGAYGTLAAAFVRNFPILIYIVGFGLGGLYNGLAALTSERLAEARYAAWKSIPIGLLTFAWPTVIIATLLR